MKSCCLRCCVRRSAPEVTATFCVLLLNPTIDLEFEYVFKKANETPIPTLYWAYGNIVNFSRTSRILFSLKLGHWNHWANGENNPKIRPFPVSHVEPHVVHQCLVRLHSPRQMTGFTHSAQLRNKVPIGYNGTPKIHSQNCPLPFDDNHQHLIHPSLDRPHSSSQTAFGSIQPFCHNTPCGQTDRQIDRPTCSVTWAAYARLIESDEANKTFVDSRPRCLCPAHEKYSWYR